VIIVFLLYFSLLIIVSFGNLTSVLKEMAKFNFKVVRMRSLGKTLPA